MLQSAEAVKRVRHSEYSQVITSLTSSTYSGLRVLARYFDFKIHNAQEHIVDVFTSTFAFLLSSSLFHSHLSTRINPPFY